MTQRDEQDRKGDPRAGGNVRFLERYKEFGPTSFAVEHRTSMLVLLAIITVLGIVS